MTRLTLSAWRSACGATRPPRRPAPAWISTAVSSPSTASHGLKVKKSNNVVQASRLHHEDGNHLLERLSSCCSGIRENSGLASQEFSRIPLHVAETCFSLAQQLTLDPIEQIADAQRA